MSKLHLWLSIRGPKTHGYLTENKKQSGALNAFGTTPRGELAKGG